MDWTIHWTQNCTDQNTCIMANITNAKKVISVSVLSFVTACISSSLDRCVFKNDARLRKPFPLLIRFSDTGEAPENLNAAPEDLNATLEDP